MTRVLSGAVLLVIAIAVVWFAPDTLFLAVAEGLLVLAAIELTALARAAARGIVGAASIAAAALTCASFADRPFGATVSLDAVLMSAVVVLGVLMLARWRDGSDALGATAAGLLPSLYLGLPLGAMVAIREGRGPKVLFLLMLTVFVSDTAQYYCGRLWGRRLLAPSISPKKTVEGAVGGFVFGALTLTVAARAWLPAIPPAVAGLLGLAIVAVGIAGDLFESALKRSARVKDSSTLIPGHGGVLDRIDALLFAAPVYYLALRAL